MDADDLVVALSKAEGHYRRCLFLGALLTKETGLGIDGLTVVGGSALEIYTEGDYVSQDIDVVAGDFDKVERVLKKWRFRHDGMYWTLRALGLDVQLVNRYDSAPSHLSRVVETPYGPVRLGAMEYILVKRLAEVRYWERPRPDGEGRSARFAEAELLARRFHREMDWEYVEFHSKREGIEDLLAKLRQRIGA